MHQSLKSLFIFKTALDSGLKPVKEDSANTSKMAVAKIKLFVPSFRNSHPVER
jgi:hypothetical protein